MHLKKKNSETNLKDLNMKKKLQQNSLLFSYLSIQNTEDIILGFNFFFKKNLQIYMVDLHHNDSNEWVCFLEKNFLRKKKKDPDGPWAMFQHWYLILFAFFWDGGMHIFRNFL